MNLAIAALLCAASTARADALADAEKEIRAAWDALAQFSAQVSVDAAIPVGENRMQLSGKGTVAYLKDGEQGKYRQDVTIQLPEPQSIEMTSSQLFDGSDLYLMNNVAGQPTNIKDEDGVDPLSPPPGGGPLLDAIKAVATLTREEDTTVDGRRAFVLVGTPSGTAAETAGFSRIVLTVDAATGARVKAEYYERGNVLTVSVTLTKLDVQTAVDAAQFTAPESSVPRAAITPAAP
jgi:hypothetical protein